MRYLAEVGVTWRRRPPQLGRSSAFGERKKHHDESMRLQVIGESPLVGSSDMSCAGSLSKRVQVSVGPHVDIPIDEARRRENSTVKRVCRQDLQLVTGI